MKRLVIGTSLLFLLFFASSGLASTYGVETLLFSSELNEGDHFEWVVHDDFGEIDGDYQLRVLKVPNENFGGNFTDEEFNDLVNEYFELSRDGEPLRDIGELLFSFILPTDVTLSDGTEGLENAFFALFTDEMFDSETANTSVSHEGPFTFFDAVVPHSFANFYLHVKVHSSTGLVTYGNSTVVSAGISKTTEIDMINSTKSLDPPSTNTPLETTAPVAMIFLIALPVVGLIKKRRT